jgi:hypothetical protein
MIIETEFNASVNSSCDHLPPPPPPPRDSVGHLYAYLSPRMGICSCVFTWGPDICQYPNRVITPGHLSLTEKRPRPRVSFVVCQNGRLYTNSKKSCQVWRIVVSYTKTRLVRLIFRAKILKLFIF